MTGKTYICQSCGIEVYGGRNGKYCPDCAKHIRLQANKEQKRIKRMQKRENLHSNSLGAIAKKAREMGISYGEFVAKYEFE